MTDDLVERVARAIYEAWCAFHGVTKTSMPWDDVWGEERQDCIAEARAAIALVLEEAAKVCDAIETKLSDQWRANYKVCDYTQGASDGANDCAAAIRALVKEPTDPGPASASGS